MIIGVVLSYEEAQGESLYDHLLDDYEWRNADRGDFVIVADGMNCEYVVAGMLVEHPTEEGFPVLQLEPSDVLVQDVEDWAEDVFGLRKPASAIVLSHWH